LGRTRYNLPLGEFPAQTPITMEVGFLQPDVASHIPWRPSLSWTTTLELGTADETIRLRAYEPRARLSRALWFGVLPGIVLVVCVTVLVRGARRHRRAGG